MEKNWILEEPTVFSASERNVSQPVFSLPEEMPPAPPVPATESAVSRTGRLTTVLAVIFLAGIGYGAALASAVDGPLAALLEQIARGYLSGRAEESFRTVFVHAAMSGMIFWGALFLAGFSAAGQPFALFFLLFRGVGLGMSMGYFYTVPDGKALFPALLLLLPAGVLSGYALVLGCRESLRMSGKFFGAMTCSAQMSPKSFRVYAVKFAIIGILLIAAAFLDAGCTQLFQYINQM